MRVVWYVEQFGNQARTKVADHHEKCDAAARQEAEYGDLGDQFAAGAEHMKGQGFEVSSFSNAGWSED